VLSEGSNLTEAAILSHCQERLAKFKLPQTVEFIEQLPRNATGKVLKTVLREKYGNH
jgi:acyl-CoA synthetase (AMP-forming)/AMP-acid ligase II